MRALHLLSTIDEVRAIADPRRIRILDLFTHETLTVSQVADRLGEPVGRVHYHVKALERAGLVRRVRTREVRGVLEKYYEAVAREFEVSPDLMRGRSRHALAGVLLRQLRAMYRQTRRAIEVIVAREGPSDRAEMRRRYPASVGAVTLHVTPQELGRMLNEIRTATKRYAGRPAKGRRAYTLWMVGHPAVPDEG